MNTSIAWNIPGWDGAITVEEYDSFDESLLPPEAPEVEKEIAMKHAPASPRELPMTQLVEQAFSGVDVNFERIGFARRINRGERGGKHLIAVWQPRPTKG